MDLVSVSAGITNPYTSYFNNSAQNYNFFGQQTNTSSIETNKSATSNIILVKKGSSGYMSDFDLDEDGKITLEEFNKYCEDNGISPKDKIKLMTSMEISKIKDKLIEENVEKTVKDEKSSKNETENDNEDKSVYAKKKVMINIMK